jgi:DNA ligase-associated metallophosphoesterase
MTTMIDVTLGDTELCLHPGRAVFWAEQKTLLVADTHFGKEATFRRHGIPVPRGSTDGTLNFLSALLVEVKAERLIALGDLFHARSSLSQDVCESMERFLGLHDSIEITLVRGNHDAHVGQLPSSWPINVVEPGARIDTLELTHEPTTPTGDAKLVLCGHLHPGVNVGNPPESLGRMSCFWWHQGCLVLPAFGLFTGLHCVKPSENDRTWFVADDQIVEHVV